MSREIAMDRVRRTVVTQAPMARSSGNRMLITIAGLFLSIALSLLLLFMANSREGLDFGGDLPTRLTAMQFIAASMLLFLASASAQIRISLQMILIYMTIYLLLPGFHHTSANTFPFYSMHYAEAVRLEAASIISIFMIALIVGYVAGDRFAGAGRAQGRVGAEIVFPNKILLITFSVAALVATVLYVGVVGLQGAFGVRSGGVGVTDRASIGLLVTLPRTITFIAFAYCYILVLRGQRADIALFFLLFNLPLFLVTNFPLALARYFLFGIILFFLVQTYNFRGALARLGLTVTFMFGALVAMPYADSFTRHIGAEVGGDFQQFFTEYLESGDFDGLQSIQNAVVYVDKEETTKGRQILSAAFFFVPRAIWSGKGEPTGVITSRAAGFEFNNISQPLPSEMYVDFGLWGVGILSLLLGFGLARLDGWLSRNWDVGPRAKLIAGVVVAFGIILMRGTLLGIVPPIAVFSAGVAVVIMVGLRKPEKIILRGRRAEMARRALRPSGASPRARLGKV